MQNETSPKPDVSTPTPDVQKVNPLLIPLSIVIAGVLIAGAVIFSGNTSGTQQIAQVPQMPGQQQVQPKPPVDISKVNIKNTPFVGNAKAPLTIAIWADYQCPFCKRFDDDTVKSLMNDYVNTGKAKIVFKDFAFLGPDSDAAALVGRAVWDIAPEKFMDWHEAMYAAQDEEHGGFGNKETILALTKTLGIDVAKVESFMTSKAAEYTKAIGADKQEGASMGVSGTPSTIVGKQLIVGAQPYATIKAAVETALAAK